MTVDIKLYAGARHLAGAESVSLDLPENATVQQLSQTLGRRRPELAQLLRHSRFAVNSAYAADQDRITAGDEIALIPPVSGG